MNKCNETSAFLILKQYYTKFQFNFIIYSNEKSLSVELAGVLHLVRDYKDLFANTAVYTNCDNHILQLCTVFLSSFSALHE